MLLDLTKRVAAIEACLKLPELNVPTSRAGDLFPACEAPPRTVEVGDPGETE